ncbi:NEQ460 [Nanoarchaeum equitans Kin4-M]|uniref:non-specific serine/threonine protein kinase n=1 Tax=Nanoarchaeum equitans (strain Kin4-M) TaxID=228908 RepID=Q74MY7_NANEQ|nr:NEQ460 [Nanoarchaeum equitans Kin4-M]
MKEEWKVFRGFLDNYTLKNLAKLESSGYLDSLEYIVAEGKESVVIKGKYEDNDIAIKIYRVMNINWKDFHRYLRQDRRFKGIRWSRVEIINEWVRREYSNLMRAYKYGINVPRPIFYRGNVLAMEFIGDQYPAPKLKDIDFDEQSINKVKENLSKDLELLVKKAKIVHGDLSPFNILYYREKPYIIDVSQAIPIDSPEAINLLKRDFSNINFFLKKYGLSLDSTLLDDLILFIKRKTSNDIELFTKPGLP